MLETAVALELIYVALGGWFPLQSAGTQKRPISGARAVE